MINNRKNDSLVERDISKFIDSNLYENKDLFKEYARTDTLEERLRRYFKHF